jgi:hypothetical protein
VRPRSPRTFNIAGAFRVLPSVPRNQIDYSGNALTTSRDALQSSRGP